MALRDMAVARNGARPRRALLLLASLLWPSLILAQSSSGGPPTPPRPLSGAEKAAVQLALNYLSSGGDSWVSALDPSSRFAGLSREEARAEIAVRAGPASGALWELLTTSSRSPSGRAVFAIEFPSGLDERLALEMTPRTGGWALRDVRIFSEPVGDAVESGSPKASSTTAAATPSHRPSPIIPFIGIALGLAAAFLAPRHFRLAAGLGLAAVIAVGVAVIGRLGEKPDAAASAVTRRPASARFQDRLAGLQKARELLASAEPNVASSGLESLPQAGLEGKVGRVWKAARVLHERNLPLASSILGSFPVDHGIPEVEILRARLNFLLGQPRQVVQAYEGAISLGADQDALFLEAAGVFRSLMDTDVADGYVAQAARNGSRLADVSYAQAAHYIRDQHGAEAEKWFHQAWQLQPIERASLVQQTFLWDLLRRPDLYRALHLDSAAEPTVRPDAPSTSPVLLPPGAQARLCGADLLFRVGSARLEVPGGACVAPQGTPVDDAGAWTRQEEKEAIADLPRLSGSASSAGALLSTALRRQIDVAATALARGHHWQEIVQLTDGVPDLIDHGSTGIVLLRAEALRRADRPVPGKALLDQAALSPSFLSRSGPSDLFDLSLALSSLGDYDTAIRVAEKAKARWPVQGTQWFVQRVKMERKLSQGFSDYESENFRIRYPRAHPESGVRKLAAVLEEERKRLSRWIPVHSYGRTEVQLLWFEDFEETYSGGVELVGLFDGRIRLPFAGGDNLDFSHPAIVSVVTHEVAHAMITELTLDGAPHWFQEGLAQHVEMRPEHFNPIPFYETHERFLALPVVDGVLQGLPAPDLAEAAYEESVWMVHYLERTGGVEAIQRLLRAFRDGASTEEALRTVSYASVEDFDKRFRVWSRLPGSHAWKGPMLRYLGNRGTSIEIPGSLRENSLRPAPQVTVPQ